MNAKQIKITELASGPPLARKSFAAAQSVAAMAAAVAVGSTASSSAAADDRTAIRAVVIAVPLRFLLSAAILSKVSTTSIAGVNQPASCVIILAS